MAFRWLRKIDCNAGVHRWGAERGVPVAVDLYGGGEVRFRGVERICGVCHARKVDIPFREPERDTPKVPKR